MHIFHFFKLDVLGTIFGFISTICYIRVSPLAWPIGLVAILCDMLLFLQTGIYGDLGLNSIYLLMTFYGWYQWKFGGENKTELPITNWSANLMLILGIISTFGIALLIIALKLFTNSQVPYLDSITTVISLVAQWLICRKVIQCWHLWFLVDALYVGMYFYKGIPAHALLNVVYLCMAVSGYYAWKRRISEVAAESY